MKVALSTIALATGVALGWGPHVAQAEEGASRRSEGAPGASAPEAGRSFAADAILPLEGAGPEASIDEVLVDLKNDVSEADILDLERTYKIDLQPNSEFSGAERIERGILPALWSADFFTRPSVAALIERLSHDPRVEHAEPMAMLGAYFVPNDPLYASKQWHLQKVGAEAAWNYACGEGVTVAVIDTGIACFDSGPFSRGSDLGGTRCVAGYNFVDDTEKAYDDQGHGTHVAGTIAQTTNNAKGVAGLAHCARLMPVKVLTKSGWGTVADVAEGIRFAADHGADVINLSLGGNIKSAVLEDAVRHAAKKGVTIVAAAGNSGRSVGYPAAYPDVIAVSATDANDTIAWFSSRGPQIAIGAPGVAVTQQTICDGGLNKCEIFGTFQGTSMASPHVAGAAALVIGMGVTDRDAVRKVLASTASPKEGAELYGAGVLRASDAVAQVFWRNLTLRAMLLALIAWFVRRRVVRRGGEFSMGRGGPVFALLAGTGLLPFLPITGIGARMGSARFILDALARPFGEWDLLVSTGIHSWLPLASALPTVILTVLFFGSKRMRPSIGGFALGSAAFLASITLSGGVATPFGDALTRVFAVANGALCVWIARIALDSKRA